MKKDYKYYIGLWAVLLVLFNVIAFASVGWIGQEKYTASFWIGYVFIMISFIGQFACAFKAFQADSAKKLFYNISLITTSYTGLILTFVVGGLCMLISPLPYWAAAIVCVCILAVNIIAVLKAVAAIDEVIRVDEKVQSSTFLIKSLIVDAESIMKRAHSEAVKAECKKVYEALRYSDPMSHESLNYVEEQIRIKISALSEAVTSNDEENGATVVEELLQLISERNAKCKLLK